MEANNVDSEKRQEIPGGQIDARQEFEKDTDEVKQTKNNTELKKFIVMKIFRTKKSIIFKKCYFRRTN